MIDVKVFTFIIINNLFKNIKKYILNITKLLKNHYTIGTFLWVDKNDLQLTCVLEQIESDWFVISIGRLFLFNPKSKAFWAKFFIVSISTCGFLEITCIQ